MRHNDKITEIVNAINKKMDNDEPLLMVSLASKLHKIAVAMPHDRTVGAIAVLVDRLKDQREILTRGELKNLYNKYYSENTKFAEHFQKELGIPEVEQTVKLAGAKDVRPEINAYQSADPILSNALASAFDKNIPLKTYSKEMEVKATSTVGFTLGSWNLKSSKLSVASGNEHFMVVQADYDTPKGMTSILVPLEIVQAKVLEPSIFMGNIGPQELNHINLKNYLVNSAGQKLKVAANDVVNVLTATITSDTSINDVEMALTKINSKRETAMPFFGDAVIAQDLNAAVEKDVKLPQAGEFSSFAEKLESPLGFANLHFGNTNVNLGRDVIARTLSDFGLKNAQIKVSNADNQAITYAVAIVGGVCFNVPVKFASNRIVSPTMLICNGSPMSLTLNSIHKLMSSKTTDYKAAAVTSPSYGLKPNELIDNVRTAMADGNYGKAEDALNILSQQDATAYKTAFAVYMNGLSVKTASKVEKETTCSKIVTSSSSEHPICSHTGLPLHKVCQDQYGNCQPLYRRGMAENYQGAMFMNAKIFG